MPLESPTHIADLVTSNPAHSDGLNNADAHIRAIKGVLKTDLPNFNAVLAASPAQLDAAVASLTGTGYIRHLLGTVSLPAITPVGDADTGIYSPGANQLHFSTGGADALRLKADHTVEAPSGFASGGPVSAAGAYSGGTGQLVPIGGTLLWWDDTLPAEGGYAWANGGTLSRTANPILWARWGTKFGAGDGATTFHVPDLRDTVPVGKGTMGGAGAAGRITNFVTTTLGTIFGACVHVLTTGEMPSHSHGVNDPGHTHPYTLFSSVNNGGSFSAYSPSANPYPIQAAATTGITIQNTGGNGAHNNVQPSTVCNFIIRIG